VQGGGQVVDLPCGLRRPARSAENQRRLAKAGMVSEHREFGVPCGVGCVGPEEDHGGPELGDGVEEGSGWQRSSEHHAGLVHFGESGGKGVQGQDVLFPVGCREQDRRAAVPATSPSDQRGQSGPGALGQQVLGRDAVRGLIEAFTASAQRWSQEVSPCVDDPMGAQRLVHDRDGSRLVELQSCGGEGLDLVGIGGWR
jgi:hypothetical protein